MTTSQKNNELNIAQRIIMVAIATACFLLIINTMFHWYGREGFLELILKVPDWGFLGDFIIFWGLVFIAVKLILKR